MGSDGQGRAGDDGKAGRVEIEAPTVCVIVGHIRGPHSLCDSGPYQGPSLFV